MRDEGQVLDVAVPPLLVERRPAIALMGAKKAVGLGDVDPAQEVGVAGGVRTAVRQCAAHPLVHPPDPGDRSLGLIGAAEGRHAEEQPSAVKAAEWVGAVRRVLGHARHRQRVQRLEQQGADPADEHRGVAVHLADGSVRREPVHRTFGCGPEVAASVGRRIARQALGQGCSDTSPHALDCHSIDTSRGVASPHGGSGGPHG